jgi:hypothetical protein
MLDLESEKPARAEYRPKGTMRDRNVVFSDAKASLGYADNDADSIARNIGSLQTMMRLQLEVLIDIRDLLARTIAVQEPGIEVNWERRKDAYRKGESYRGLE